MITHLLRIQLLVILLQDSYKNHDENTDVKLSCDVDKMTLVKVKVTEINVYKKIKCE